MYSGRVLEHQTVCTLHLMIGRYLFAPTVFGFLEILQDFLGY